MIKNFKLQKEVKKQNYIQKKDVIFGVFVYTFLENR